MHKLVEHLKFLLNSTNQHGVHSPFLYNYVTQCLYARSKYHDVKTIDVLLKSIRYFKVKNIALSPKQKIIEHTIVTEFKYIAFENKPYDLVYMDISDFEGTFPLLSNKIHNDTLLLLNDIYKNRESIKLWKTIKKREEITLTIDMFYCAVVFFRKEQVKEHFKIRI